MNTNNKLYIIEQYCTVRPTVKAAGIPFEKYSNPNLN